MSACMDAVEMRVGEFNQPDGFITRVIAGGIISQVEEMTGDPMITARLRTIVHNAEGHFACSTHGR